jgi:hypothetical protein
MKKKDKRGKLEKKEVSNFRKKKIKGASWKKVQKYKRKGEKRERKALWITIVIHSAFRCGEIVISPHPLVLCIIV